MKIRADKEYTENYQMAKVKEDIAEFKERYTEKDILNSFRAQCDWWENQCAEILKCEINAFPAGWAYDDETHFHVVMYLDGFTEMNKLSFYVNLDLDVNTSTHPCKMVDIKTYKIDW